MPVHLIAGTNNARPIGKFFYPHGLNTVLCHKHTKGLDLQPVTSYDIEKGYGTDDCPFCPGGPLHGKYSRLRSEHALELAVRRIEDPLATLKPCIEEEDWVTVYKVVYPNGGTRRFLTKNGAIDRLAWVMINDKCDWDEQYVDGMQEYLGRVYARLVRYLKFMGA